MSEWDENFRQHIEPIAEQLVKAKWAKAYVWNQSGIVFDWTEDGLQRLRSLWEIVNELTLQSFQTERLIGLWAILVMIAREKNWSQ